MNIYHGNPCCGDNQTCGCGGHPLVICCGQCQPGCRPGPAVPDLSEDDSMVTVIRRFNELLHSLRKSGCIEPCGEQMH